MEARGTARHLRTSWAWLAGASAALCVVLLAVAPGSSARPRAHNVVGVEHVGVSATSVTVRGWATRSHHPRHVRVTVTLDGHRRAGVSARRADAHRPHHGFRVTVALPAGPHRVCVRSWRAHPVCRTVAGRARTARKPAATPRPAPSKARAQAPTHAPTHGPTAPPTHGPTAPPTDAPTVPPVDPPSTPPAASCVANPTGIPASGGYVGAAVSGTQNIATLEDQTGQPLGVHRTYFTGGQVDYAVSSVKADLAAGRLPWISFKLPYSWADMAAGRGDDWTLDLVTKLSRVGGPVWLTFHHEPETDGPIADWIRMQRHLYPLVHAHSRNIAVAIIIIAWDALHWPTPEYHLDNIWPGDDYVDILGVDIYNEYGTTKHGMSNTNMLAASQYFRAFGEFARTHHVHWAVGETGYSNDAAARNPKWLVDTYEDLRAEGGLAMAYFDSSYNSITDWTLSTPGKLDAFTTILRRSARLC